MSRGPSAAEKMIGDFAPKLVELTDRVLFGDVWERQDLSKRDRSLITVAALIALNRPEQLRFHLDKALDNGLKKEELIEAITHLAFYAQTVNVIGAIKTTKTTAEMETTGLVLQLYREHFGQIPLRLAGDFGPLDVAAALTADGRFLTVAVVNPTAVAVELPLDLGTHRVVGRATRWLIAAADEHAHNTPGLPRQVDLTHVDDLDGSRPLAVPALGIALFVLPLTTP